MIHLHIVVLCLKSSVVSEDRMLLESERFLYLYWKRDKTQGNMHESLKLMMSKFLLTSVLLTKDDCDKSLLSSSVLLGNFAVIVMFKTVLSFFIFCLSSVLCTTKLKRHSSTEQDLFVTVFSWFRFLGKNCTHTKKGTITIWLKYWKLKPVLFEVYETALWSSELR